MIAVPRPIPKIFTTTPGVNAIDALRTGLASAIEADEDVKHSVEAIDTLLTFLRGGLAALQDQGAGG